ncbi:MAG TPA: radical SAM protein [Candidatus Limnocylindrales bacterium]|nr:radical SAM protein [Candidatus Limnocylindrales bacterium]
MNILIIYPPCRESRMPLLPLGLLYVAQPLIEDGHNVKFFDIALEKPTREEVISKLKSEKFDLMIIGGIVTTYSYVKWLTNEVKKLYPDTPILGGGYVASPIPHVIFKNTGIDVICNGEGDITVREYVSALDNRTDISNIAGLFIKKGDSYITTQERPLIKELDDINPPVDAYKLLNIERYINGYGKLYESLFESGLVWVTPLKEYRGFDLLSGRGCVGNCTFCYRMLKGMRKHSVPYVLKHMRYLVENYRVNLFLFSDELFVNNNKWIDEFCKSLKESNMAVYFDVNSRANLVTEELVQKLKSVNCIDISVGFESFSQRMLDSMNKRVNVETNKNVYKILKKHKMITGVNTIQGMPGETRETIMETMKFIEDCKIESASNYYVTPYPDSEIYQYALKEGLIQDEDKYLEGISNSDAGEFKINLTQLSDTDLKYYTWLLRDACRKNALQNGLKNRKIKKLVYYKFLLKQYGLKISYKIGLFGTTWNINNMIETKIKNISKI